jgi:hypothetical protein
MKKFLLTVAAFALGAAMNLQAQIQQDREKTKTEKEGTYKPKSDKKADPCAPKMEKGATCGPKDKKHDDMHMKKNPCAPHKDDHHKSKKDNPCAPKK